MRNHKWAALPLAIGLLLSSVPAVQAADTTQSNLMTQDQAVQLARQTFGIGDDYTLKKTKTNNPAGNESLIWQFTFTKGSGKTIETVHADVQQSTGAILRYLRDGEANTKVSISEENAHANAWAWVQKLVPEQVSQLKDTWQPGKGKTFKFFGQQLHIFSFERECNGIPFPENGVQVVIDQTGKLQEYIDRWTTPDAQLPKPDVFINQEQANSLYESQLPMQLEYGASDPEDSPYFGPQTQLWYTDTYANSANLDYQVSPFLDAQTGKMMDVYNQPYQWFTAHAPLAAQPGQAPAQGGVDQQEALVLALRYAHLDNSMQLESQDLHKEQQSWYFTWQDASKTRKLFVSIDSKNGELKAFNALPDFPDFPDKKTAEQTPQVKWTDARDQAVDFVQQALPTQANTLYLVNNEKSSLLDTLGSPQYHFIFATMQNGIVDSTTACDVIVDAVTGKIIGFFANDPVNPNDFPDPHRAMSVQAAKEQFLQKYPLQLQYVQTYDNGEVAGIPQTKPNRGDIILAYVPAKPFNQYQLDAINGIWVDDSGMPEEKDVNDIGTHWGSWELQNMVDYNVFALDADNNVHPDAAATREEAIHALIMASVHTQIDPQPQSTFSDVPTTDPNHDVIEQAVSMGLLPHVDGQFHPNDQLTRLDLAKWVAKLLAGKKPSRKKPLDPRKKFSDLAGLNQADIDAISTVLNHEVMSGNGGKFDPNATVTRAQLAVVADLLGTDIEWETDK